MPEENQTMESPRTSTVHQNGIHGQSPKLGKDVNLWTQEATVDFTVSITYALVEDLPSKHLWFLSFQRAQITARKEEGHIILPLIVPILNFRDTKWLQRDLREHPTALKSAKNWFPNDLRHRSVKQQVSHRFFGWKAQKDSVTTIVPCWWRHR